METINTAIFLDDTHYSFSYRIGTMEGCCGAGVIAALEVHDDAVLSLPTQQRSWIALKIGECIVRSMKENNFGMALCTTLAPEVEVHDPSQAYYHSMSSSHKPELNLGTIFEQLGAERSCTVRNPRTGNSITSYTLDVTD